MPPVRRISEHALLRTSGATPRSGNRLAILRNAEATYDDWLRAISEAKRWIHLDNYIFLDDDVGARFAEALAERARAGILVRVLYDWYGSWNVGAAFWSSLRDAGVEVRTINPPHPVDPLGVLRRDHRKLLAVDGVYGSVGGVGIADAWLQRAPDTGLPYRDTCIAVRGPAVADIERAFADIWDLNGAPLPEAERPRVEELEAAGAMSARVVIQEPGRLRISRLLQVLCASTEQRLWIADAYFLADPILREALIAAARDGVDVRLLAPSTNDLPLVGAVSRTNYRSLLEAGARIWEYRGPMMHAKTIVADGWCSRVGSTNLNITGLMTNWEIDVVVEDAAFAAEMERMFLEDLTDARELRLDGREVRGGLGLKRPQSLVRGSGTQMSSTLASLGGALAQGALSTALARDERNLSFAVGAGAVVSAIALVRFPRLLAWPLAVSLCLAGVSALARAFGFRRDRRG